LAETYGKAGQAEEGLSVLTEALDFVDKTGERCYEAELYRIKGELLLAQARQQATGERATVRQQSSVEKKTKSKGRKLLFPDP
jgi:predicted ATPase